MIFFLFDFNFFLILLKFVYGAIKLAVDSSKLCRLPGTWRYLNTQIGMPFVVGCLRIEDMCCCLSRLAAVCMSSQV